MKVDRFVNVGENIHCTRILKVGGKMVSKLDNGTFVIPFTKDGKPSALPVPQKFTSNADWEAGKVKHCAVAIWQGRYGSGDDKIRGAEYIHSLAAAQEKSGANYLDINVDEFSTDISERLDCIRWTVAEMQKASSLPASIDSSNTQILEAGLSACDRKRGRPMVNSVSLEREDAINAAAAANAVVIASAAGRTGLPSSVAERLKNIDELMVILKTKGFDLPSIHVDPLVFPISTDSSNGKGFLETVSAIRRKYGPQVHIVAGLSNVSFGMPNRKLINQVFAWLAVEAGADGGIVDPVQINASILGKLDPASNDFLLARALLLGEDEFGMNFIETFRKGA